MSLADFMVEVSSYIAAAVPGLAVFIAAAAVVGLAMFAARRVGMALRDGPAFSEGRGPTINDDTPFD